MQLEHSLLWSLADKRTSLSQDRANLHRCRADSMMAEKRRRSCMPLLGGVGGESHSLHRRKCVLEHAGIEADPREAPHLRTKIFLWLRQSNSAIESRWPNQKAAINVAF